MKSLLFLSDEQTYLSMCCCYSNKKVLERVNNGVENKPPSNLPTNQSPDSTRRTSDLQMEGAIQRKTGSERMQRPSAWKRMWSVRLAERAEMIYR